MQEEASMQDRADEQARFIPDMRLRRGGQGSGSRWAAALALAALLTVTVASPGHADEYDASNAGHPVRIVAYVLHPVGVLLDYLLLRPAHWVVSQEPMATIFGHED